MNDQPDTTHEDQASDHAHTGPDFGPPPPRWPKPIGTISLILGILAVTCGILGIGMTFAGSALMASLMGGQLPPGTPPPPMSPPLDAVLITSSSIGLISNLLLLAAAAALLRRREKARTLHLVYALVGIVAAFTGAYAGHHGQQAQAAAMEAWIADHGHTEVGQAIAQSQQAQAGVQSTMQLVFLAVFTLIALAWPVFCIIWFGMIKRDADDITGRS